MNRRRILTAVAAVGLLAALGLGYRSFRGPVGDLSAEAKGKAVPEFTSLDPSRWQNSAPASLAAAKGEVVFVEGWSPG